MSNSKTMSSPAIGLLILVGAENIGPSGDDSTPAITEGAPDARTLVAEPRRARDPAARLGPRALAGDIAGHLPGTFGAVGRTSASFARRGWCGCAARGAGGSTSPTGRGWAISAPAGGDVDDEHRPARARGRGGGGAMTEPAVERAVIERVIVAAPERVYALPTTAEGWLSRHGRRPRSMRGQGASWGRRERRRLCRRALRGGGAARRLAFTWAGRPRITRCPGILAGRDRPRRGGGGDPTAPDAHGWRPRLRREGRGGVEPLHGPAGGGRPRGRPGAGSLADRARRSRRSPPEPGRRPCPGVRVRAVPDAATAPRAGLLRRRQHPACCSGSCPG